MCGARNWWRMRRRAASRPCEQRNTSGAWKPPGKEREHGLVCGGAYHRLRALSRGCGRPSRGLCRQDLTHPSQRAHAGGSLSMSHMTRAPPHATSSEAMPTWRRRCESPGRLPPTPSSPLYIFLLILNYQALPRSAFVSQFPLGEAHHLQCSDPSLNGLLSHFPSFRYDRFCSVSFLE